MKETPIGKLLIQMSLPPLFSMFLQYSYNLADSAFVARLSENALTAVSLSFPITTLMNAVSIWIGVGVNVLIAGHLGRKEQDETNDTVTMGLILSFAVGFLLNVFALLLIKPYFSTFTENKEIYMLSLKYMGVCAFMQIPNMVHIAIQKMIQATGNMIAPMWFQVAGVVFNFIFDPLLIFGIGPFPEMGIRGAAVATGGRILHFHVFGILDAALYKTTDICQSSRISFPVDYGTPNFLSWSTIFYYERTKRLYGLHRQSVPGSLL